MFSIKKLQGLSPSSKTTVNTVASNAARLVESIALLVVSYFSYSQAHHAHLSGVVYKIVVASALVIGLRGAYEMLRYLGEK